MRECGACNLCCTLLFVPELNKGQGKKCQHCDNGCSIYEDRPVSCVSFKCAWLQGDLDERCRPDKVHFLIEKLSDVPVVLAMLEDGYSITEEITGILSFYKDEGIAVVANNGQGLLPEGISPEVVREHVIDYAKEVGVA